MSFATTLNSYCNALGCSNKQIAERCGVSASALSRYRNGERVPDAHGDAVKSLSMGIASLARERGVASASSDDSVLHELEASLGRARIAGMGFGKRLDALMNVLGMRNSELAALVGVDPSFLSRIRNDQRLPSDQETFAEKCARYATVWATDHDRLEELAELVEGAQDALARNLPTVDLQSDLFDEIMQWLQGGSVMQDDVRELQSLFDMMDQRDVGELEAKLEAARRAVVEKTGAFAAGKAHSRFFYGLDEMREAELAFLDMAFETGASDILMSSDIPLFDNSIGPDFLEQYHSRMLRLLASGARVNVIHSVERPMAETILALRQWVPLYLTGLVTPYYLKGVHNRLFCHANNVCENGAMAAEAVVGHEEEGRYYLTTYPDEVAYYQRKMQLVLAQSSSLLEMYRTDDPAGLADFEQAESRRAQSGRGRPILAGRYRHMNITLYPGDCAVIALDRGRVRHLVIRHPKIRYTMSLMS